MKSDFRKRLVKDGVLSEDNDCRDLIVRFAGGGCPACGHKESGVIEVYRIKNRFLL